MKIENLAGTHQIQHRVLDVFLGSLRAGVSVSKRPNIVRHLRISIPRHYTIGALPAYVGYIPITLTKTVRESSKTSIKST